MKHMPWGFLFTAIATCYTYVQLKDIECKTYCHGKGYTSGVYTDRCWCANQVEEERIQEKAILLPKKPIKSNYVPSLPRYDESDIKVPYKAPWED